METIQETRKMIFELTKAGMDLAGIYILKIYPGMEYYANPEKYGLKVIERENFKSTLCSEYAGHHTEGLTSKQILKEANKLANELFEYYLEQND
ncbi:MAG: hypothetical protein ACFFAN_02790 [Promethearchaeota archaeon]